MGACEVKEVWHNGNRLDPELVAVFYQTMDDGEGDTDD